MTSLDFSMVLKTCVCAAAPDTSLDITATRTKADQGGSQQAAGAGAASGRMEVGLGEEEGSDVAAEESLT